LVELAYNGEAFHGLAPQAGLTTVSSTLKAALEQHFALPAQGLTFAARTDAGVSALQNFATVSLRATRDLAAEVATLAALRLADLEVKSAVLVDRRVNARTYANSKHYRYRVSCTPEPAHRTWALGSALDVKRMQTAAEFLLGTHDFSAFRAANCGSKNPTKQLTRVEVTQHQHVVQIDIEGNSFLRRMMRIISGSLIEVGTGVRPTESIRELLLTGDRSAAGVTAPACGLELVSVSLSG
jgi:tRNA pseudouridine38-40 synthase